MYLQQKQMNVFHQVFQRLQYFFKDIENKYDVYRGKDFMKRF